MAAPVIRQWTEQPTGERRGTSTSSSFPHFCFLFLVFSMDFGKFKKNIVKPFALSLSKRERRKPAPCERDSAFDRTRHYSASQNVDSG